MAPKLRHATVNAVILTGKRTAHNQFLQLAGVTNKALIEIDGKAMIQHVIDALNDSRYIERIYLVAPEDFKELSFDSRKPIDVVPCGDTVVENLMLSVSKSGDAENVVQSDNERDRNLAATIATPKKETNAP